MTELSERETRMLRELAERHGLTVFDGQRKDMPEAVAALSELLLAAKARACKDVCEYCRGGELSSYEAIPIPGHGGWLWHVCKIAGKESAPCVARPIRNSDWGDLFEEKA